MCSRINKEEQNGGHIVYKVSQTYLIIEPSPHMIFFKIQSSCYTVSFHIYIVI